MPREEESDFEYPLDPHRLANLPTVEVEGRLLLDPAGADSSDVEVLWVNGALPAIWHAVKNALPSLGTGDDEVHITQKLRWLRIIALSLDPTTDIGVQRKSGTKRLSFRDISMLVSESASEQDISTSRVDQIIKNFRDAVKRNLAELQKNSGVDYSRITDLRASNLRSLMEAEIRLFLDRLNGASPAVDDPKKEWHTQSLDAKMSDWRKLPPQSKSLPKTFTLTKLVAAELSERLTGPGEDVDGMSQSTVIRTERIQELAEMLVTLTKAMGGSQRSLKRDLVLNNLHSAVTSLVNVLPKVEDKLVDATLWNGIVGPRRHRVEQTLSEYLRSTTLPKVIAGESTQVNPVAEPKPRRTLPQL